MVLKNNPQLKHINLGIRQSTNYMYNFLIDQLLYLQDFLAKRQTWTKLQFKFPSAIPKWCRSICGNHFRYLPLGLWRCQNVRNWKKSISDGGILLIPTFF